MIVEGKKMDGRSFGVGSPVEDLRGQEFGKLTVQDRFKFTHPSGNVSWKCRCLCSCGNTFDAHRSDLKSGKITHCGCSRKRLRRSPPKYLGTDSLVGERFGTVVVTKCYYVKNKSGTKMRWCETLCDCGRTGSCNSTSLINSKKNRSCGYFPCSPASRGYEQITGNNWYHIRSGARKRGLEFNITIDQAWDLLVKQGFRCALTGRSIKFDIGRGKGTASTNDRDSMNNASLDRRDSQKGYTLDNVQWVARIANFCKQAYDENDFIELCKDVAKAHNERVAAKGQSDSLPPQPTPSLLTSHGEK